MKIRMLFIFILFFITSNSLSAQYILQISPFDGYGNLENIDFETERGLGTIFGNSWTSNNNTSSISGDWRTIKTFTGSGIKNTAPFTVNKNEWKVIYKSTANNPVLNGAGHIFQLFLLEPGQEVFQGEIIANVANKETISGESYVYKSGRFYFNSNSANGDWEIKIQVQD